MLVLLYIHGIHVCKVVIPSFQCSHKGLDLPMQTSVKLRSTSGEMSTATCRELSTLIRLMNPAYCSSQGEVQLRPTQRISGQSSWIPCWTQTSCTSSAKANAKAIHV